MLNIAVLTSGGDSPAMNAAVTSVVRAATHYGMNVLGVWGGYHGLLETPENQDGDFATLKLRNVLNIVDLPGTYLRTARCDEFRRPEVREKAAELLKRKRIDGLVVIGGDGSMTGAGYLCELGIPCIGIPGTIDNDLGYTELTLGFDTAVNTCLEAVRAIRATSRSHHRAHVVEVMGRHSGNIAASVAAAGADVVMVPEHPMSVQEVSEALKQQAAQGNECPIIVAAEGCWHDWPEMKSFDVAGFLRPLEEKAGVKPEDQTLPGTRMNAEYCAKVLEHMSGIEVRHTVIGYTQRGGIPTAQDNTFAFQAGALAVRLLRDGKENLAIGIKGGHVFSMPIADALKMPPRFDEELYRLINSNNKE